MARCESVLNVCGRDHQCEYDQGHEGQHWESEAMAHWGDVEAERSQDGPIVIDGTGA